MIVRYQEDIKYVAPKEDPKEEKVIPKQQVIEPAVAELHKAIAQEVDEVESREAVSVGGDEPLVISELELEEKINEAKALGFASGYQQREEELDQQQRELEQQLLACYQSISATIAGVGDQLEQGWKDISSATVNFAQNLVAKLVDNLPELGLAKIIDNILQEVLPKLAIYPELRLQVAPALVPFLEQQCAEWCSKNHFPGKVMVLADSELTGAACQISWEDGFLVMDSKHLWQEADQLIKRQFSFLEDHASNEKTLMPEVMMDE